MKPKSLIRNARNPKGFWGNLMINAMNKGHAALSVWGLDALNNAHVDHAVDIGCGGGANLKRLAELSETVYGIDPSPLCLARSQRKTAHLVKHGRVQLIEGTAALLHFADCSIELVTAFETVYFWSNIELCFAEIYRVLSPKGTFLIVNELVAEKEQDSRFSYLKSIVQMTVYTNEQLLSLLADAKFSDVRAELNEDGAWVRIVGKKSKFAVSTD